MKNFRDYSLCVAIGAVLAAILVFVPMFARAVLF